MTWLDIGLFLVWIIFIALGARMGSLWTGACIVGGFFGAALVDYYALPLAGLMGDFPGASVAAAAILYLAGVGAILIPGTVISKIGSAMFLNIIDSAFGLFTGAFAGLFFISLSLLFLIPFFPSFERSPAFRNSEMVKPFYRTIEEVFNHTPIQRAHDRIEKEARQKFTPMAREVENKFSDLKSEVVNKVKK